MLNTSDYTCLGENLQLGENCSTKNRKLVALCYMHVLFHGGLNFEQANLSAKHCVGMLDKAIYE